MPNRCKHVLDGYHALHGYDAAKHDPDYEADDFITEHCADDKPDAYIGNALNYIDLPVFDVYAVMRELHVTGVGELNKDWLFRISARIAFTKCVQVLYTMRPFNLCFFGVEDFTPVLHTFKNMGGRSVMPQLS